MNNRCWYCGSNDGILEGPISFECQRDGASWDDRTTGLKGLVYSQENTTRVVHQKCIDYYNSRGGDWRVLVLKKVKSKIRKDGSFTIKT